MYYHYYYYSEGDHGVDAEVEDERLEEFEEGWNCEQVPLAGS
jgi:hypothetical protein